MIKEVKIKTWQIITVIICLILGILLHFTYEWFGKNLMVGIFSAVNESTWEHLKLAFYPMLIMAVIGYFIIGDMSDNYWLAQALGIITALIFIISFFYTYRGIIGINIDSLNIGSFFIAIFLGEYITYKILISNKNYNAEKISVIFLIILLFSFILYTFSSPEIPLFEDPRNGSCGIM